MKNTYHQEEVTFDLAEGRAILLLRRPTHRECRPGLLLNLALDRHTTLESLPFSTVSDYLLAKGFCVASLDLPCHGSNVDPVACGEGLFGVAHALQAGTDVFKPFAKTVSSILDGCSARGIARNYPIAVAGTSRGALFAMHCVAAEPRLITAALFSPLTRLEALGEFQKAGHPETYKKYNALSTVKALSERPVFMAINSDDTRVGTPFAEEFAAAMSSAGARRFSFVRVPGNGHRVSSEVYEQGARFLINELSSRQVS